MFGTRSVSYTVTANESDEPRSGYIELAGEELRIHQVGAAETGYDGWWYDAANPGSGLALETRGDKLFAAWFSYDGQTGEAIWTAALLSRTDEAAYGGELLRYDPSGNVTDMGWMTLTFSSDDNVILGWYSNTLQTPYLSSMTRVMYDVAPGVADSRDIHGWWTAQGQDFTGLFMEARGGELYGGWYDYREDGSPVWRSFGANVESALDDLADGQEWFESPLYEYSGGQPMAGAHSQAQSAIVGRVAIQFLEDGSAELHLYAEDQVTWLAAYTLERISF